MNHDGIFSTSTFYYQTEEVFFPDFEFGGPPHSDDPAVRQRYVDHDPAAAIGKWRTPTLVVHGGRDYRILESDGIATFTALQRQGVPSELLYFPAVSPNRHTAFCTRQSAQKEAAGEQENHHVLSRQNSIVWYDKVLGWMDRWLGAGAKL